MPSLKVQMQFVRDVNDPVEYIRPASRAHIRFTVFGNEFFGIVISGKLMKGRVSFMGESGPWQVAK